MISDQTENSDDKLLQISCSVIDFGEVNYIPSIKFFTNSKKLQITNSSNTHKIHIKSCSLNAKQEINDFPVKVQISTNDENENFAEIILNPNESKDLFIRLISIHENSQWNERTSFFKISSSLHFQYKIISNESANNFETESITYYSIPWKYKATLCTSVLCMDETELRFGSCAIGADELRSRTFQIWNRSESVLKCCIKFMDIKVKSSIINVIGDIFDESSINRLSIQSIVEFQDYETDVVIHLDEEISIPPFASKRLRGIFQPKELGCIIAFYKIANLNNPANTVILSCQINVDVSENPFDILVSMEDDDTAVDILTSSISNTKENEDSLDEAALICLGDTYCGYKKFKRYWLSNNSPFDIDVSFTLNFEKQFRLLLNELQIHDSASSLNQTLIDRTTCISQYKKSEISSEPISKNTETNELSTLISLTNEKSLDQLSNAGKPIGEDLVDLSQNADTNNNGVRSFIGKNKQNKINTMKYLDNNDNNEIDNSLNWGQFKDNGSLAKRKVTGNNLSLGSNALSIICGRMWGQERILAEISNELYFEDFDGTSTPCVSINFANTRRPFIGETSKAAKVSKANKNFEKLNKQLYEERRRVETQLADPAVIESEILERNAEIHEITSNHVNVAIKDLVISEFQPIASILKENNKDESVSYSRNSNKNSDAILHSFMLKSQERRLITIELCPSFHFVNEETGTVIDGCLLDRSIHVKLECNSISIDPKQCFSRCLTFSFRACCSIISVLPNIYDMGLCNVGEYRNVLLEVKNESELPALIYPWVESKTLEITEQQQEVRIPAHDTKQIKIGYMAKSPDSDYVENVVLINAYNIENTKEIELKAKNVDTHQILLHSLFYKLITYNDKRELQINFDRCLINMPNMRVFSIKNVHSTELKLNILWQSKSNIRLYLISPPDSSEDCVEEIKHTNYIPLSRTVSFQKTVDGNEANRRDQAIEDLKWGDNDLANSIISIQARKTQSFRLSLGDELISGGSTNPPNSLNFLESSSFKSTDGLRDTKASRSADLLSILDVTHGEISTSIPQRSTTIRALNLTQKFSNDSDNPELSVLNTIAQQEKIVDNELRDVIKSVDDGLELINLFDKDSFPFKLLDTFESVDADQLKQKLYVENKVKLIQKTFTELQNLFLKKSKRNYLRPLQNPHFIENSFGSNLDLDNSVEITIPVNSSNRLALVIEPQQHNENDLEEYNQLDVRELIQIHLPYLSINDTEKRIDDDSLSKPIHAQQRREPLRPRILPVCAKLVRSEMVVIQKNISFGRTIVGDNTSRFVSVVNRSSIPCVYAICKSGSISSGFLKIPEGRQGFIAALSTKYIEFIFKPTLPGTFEETLQINNVLNPRNSQTITIKAKVLKKEAFIITADANSHISTDACNSIEKCFQDMLNFALHPHEYEFPSNLQRSKSDNSPSVSVMDRKSLIPNTSNVAASFNIGSIAVGDDSDEKNFSFRIKNVTSKSRQFIVDATHVNAVVLLTHILPAFGSTSDLNYVKNISFELEKLAFVSLFEPIPEVLQAVLSLRCRFESKVLNTSLEVGNKGMNENILSVEDRKVLEDSLEQFQQKLKIAIRKNKIEKIEKYQKKIDKVIDSLKDNKVSTISNIEQGDLMPSIETMIPTKPIQSLNEDQLLSNTVDTKNKSISTHSSSRSEVSYHFHLEPEEEKLISIKLCFLPGMSYRSWNGLLPFCGYLRIFECKNEDHVKIVRFGAMIRSTRMNINSTVPFAALNNLDISQQPEINDVKLDGITEEEDSEMRTWAVRMQSKQSFITTVAQWSSLSTVEVYPKYRQLPQNMLSMCIKLVQGSKDRVMHGAMSIASLMEQVGIVSLSIDEDFSANKSSEYITYNPKLHGNISFSLAPQTSVVSNTTTNSQNVLESSIKAEIGSLATQIGANDYSRTNLGSKKDKIVKESNQLESESKLKGGSKIDIIVKWYPPLELDHTKTQHSLSSAEATQTFKSFKILGAVKVQLRIGNQIIGALQSVPFIGVLEHKSTINIPKYFTFDDVAVGSYRTCQICIMNTSNTDDFHYVISSEEVAATSRPLGKLEIINGQTGIISPNNSKQLSLLFSATAPGKFEQKLWIRNIRDSFDQKRIVIQASISVTQMKFVIFPDLEYATDTIGKFKPIDLGFIQIQTIAKPELLPILPNTNNQSYKLKVLNVSGKDLAVTAVSNLKNQCYIYSDESCQQLAINCLFPKEEMIILYIVIRPVSIKPKSNNLMSTTSITHKNVQNVFESSSNLDIITDESLKSKSFDDDGRELIGGIKLFFFAVEKMLDTENIDEVVVSNLESDKSQSYQIVNEKTFTNIENTSADVLSLNGNTRKLFETALSFKAIVGKSLLTISPISTNAIQYIKIPDNCDSNALYFTSKFQLKNTSKLFSLKYSYLVSNPSEECIGRRSDLLENTVPKSYLEGYDSKSCCFKVKILDNIIGELQPDESVWVSYIVLYSLQTVGVVVFPIRIVNLNTFEYSFLDTSTVFDSYQIQSYARLGCSQSLLENDSINNEGYPDVSQIFSLKCSSPICLHHQYLEAINKTTAVSNDAELEFRLPRDEKYVQRDFKGLMSISESNVGRSYIETNLCSWTIRNNMNKSIILSPLSDLPITVKLEVLGNVLQPNLRLTSITIDDMDSSSLSFSKTISSEILQWRKYLRRCGESFTLEPNCEMNVILVANEDLSFEETYLKDMSNLTGNQSLQRLKAGKLVQIQGVVGFLQATHSLQNLFKPSDVPQLLMDPIVSNTLEETLTLHTTNSNESKLVNNSIIKSNCGNDPFHLLPIIGLTALTCEIVYPLLQLTEKEVSLGSLRCGQKTSFSVTIENISEIDVPCVVDKLPSWLNFENLYEIELASIDESIESVDPISCSISSFDETFIIPKQKKILLKLTAIAPNIDSRVLEHSLILKTLLSTKTASINELDLDQEPRNLSRTFVDSHEVLVRLQVDATKALELIPAEDEVLFAKNIQKTRYTQAHMCEQQFPTLDKSSLLANKSKEESGALFIRLIKDPFIIPPPVDISLVKGLQLNESVSDIVPLQVSIRDTNQSHCRFSLKNKLNTSIIVNALIELNPLISDLLELAVIFRTNNSTCIELETGEVSQVEIRVLPKLNARLNTSKLENSIYHLDNIQIPSTDPNFLLQQSFEETDKANKTNFDAKLNTPTLLGTILFIPNLKDISCKIQSNQQSDDDKSLINQNFSGIMADKNTSTIVKDAILLDIVGFLQPGNTMSSLISAPKTQSISELLVLDTQQFNNDLISSRSAEVLNFRSSTLNLTQSKDDDKSFIEISASQATSNFPISPYINLTDKELYFYIMNPSSTENLNYFIKAKSYRHAGMKLIIDNLDEFEKFKNTSNVNYYDTIFPLSEPARGSIPPSSAQRITLKLVPGKVSVAIKSSSTLNTDIPDINMRNKRLMPQHDTSHKAMMINNTVNLTSLTNQSTPIGPYTIMCMPIEVWDANNYNHPPRLIFVYLTCEVALPILVTQPVSETNRNKQHLDRPLIDGEKIVYSESDTLPSSIASRSEDDITAGSLKMQLADDIFNETVEKNNILSSLYIRLRGVTPHSNIKGRYLIDLGQQILRREALEWMLTLENCSDNTSIPYRIRPIFQEELESWLSLGQTGGVIEAGDSRSVMFYFRRNIIGIYMTYIAIENLFEKSNIYIISILMEVVSDPKKTTNNTAAPINNVIFNATVTGSCINTSQIDNSDINPKVDYIKPVYANNTDNDNLILHKKIENNDPINLKKSTVKEISTVKKVFKSSRSLFGIEVLYNNDSIGLKTFLDDVILLSKESCRYRCFKINNFSDILLNFIVNLTHHSHGIKLSLINLDEEILSENEFHIVMDKSFKGLVNENQNANEELLFSIDAKRHAYLTISLISLSNEEQSTMIKSSQQCEQKMILEEFMLLIGCELFEDQNKTLKINICK